jgi:hypothetical protein
LQSIALTSPDGVTWQARPSIPGEGITDLAFGNGRVAAAGDDPNLGTLAISDVIAPALPALSIAHSGSNVVLTWPAADTGWTLQSAPGLATPASWTDWPEAPAVVGAEFRVTAPIVGDKQFFRLRE